MTTGNVILLEDWAVVEERRPGFARELRGVVLTGTAYGHPRHPDTAWPCTTSRLVSSEGRYVTTASGTIYQFGEPSPKYLEVMREHYAGRFDWDNPVKVPKAE